MKETIHDIVLIKVAERTVSLLMLLYALRYEETKTQSVHEEIILTQPQTLKFKGLILVAEAERSNTEPFLYYLVTCVKLHYDKYDKWMSLIWSPSRGSFSVKFHLACTLSGYLRQASPAVRLLLPLGWKSQLLPRPFAYYCFP